MTEGPDRGVSPAERVRRGDPGWVALDNLPELSPGWITARQLERMIAHHRDPTLPTEFD